MNKRLKKLAYIDEDKVQALADYLEVDINDIEVDDNEYLLSEIYKLSDGSEYYVMTEREADVAVAQDIESLVDECGFDEAFGNYLDDLIYHHCFDDDYFKECCEEWFQSYVDDISDEDSDIYENRLIEECYDWGIIDDDDLDDDYRYIGDCEEYELIDKLYDTLLDNVIDEYEYYIDWYVYHYGMEELDYIVKNFSWVLDYDRMAEYFLTLNGYGNYLSGYDGQTIELNSDYYAFRIN